MSYNFWEGKEIYQRRTLLQGAPIIEEATFDHIEGCFINKKIIQSSTSREQTTDDSLFNELKEQYNDHFTKQTNAHRSAFLALNAEPAPFITQEIENLIRISLDANEPSITYFIFNVKGIRTKVAKDRCLQRTTDSDDVIISWSLSQHQETATKIYTIAKKLYEKQKGAEFRTDNQGQLQK
jgi:hypothetical protein